MAFRGTAKNEKQKLNIFGGRELKGLRPRTKKEKVKRPSPAIS